MDDRNMARYEVVARANVGRQLSPTESIEMALKAHALDKGMRFQRVENLPDGEIAVVLQRRLNHRKPDQAHLMARRSLATLGIPALKVQQIDLHRLGRGSRTLVRSWVGPGYDGGGPGTAGDREPRNPLPKPPHLRAALDVRRES
jgi:hypothetical protein